MEQSAAQQASINGRFGRVLSLLKSGYFRLNILPKCLIVLLLPVYGIYLSEPAAGEFHDEGLYIVTAQSLAAGTGYRIVSLPSEIPQTKYPILFPAILSLLVRVSPVFPHNLATLKLISLASTVLWCFACLRLFRDLNSPNWIWWILFFTLAFPWVIFLSTTALPDTLFACLSTWSLVFVTRAWKDGDSQITRNVLLGGALAGAAFLTRTMGIALIFAATAALLYKRTYRQALIFTALWAGMCFPWLYWQAAQPAPGDRVQSYYSKLSYAQGTIIGGYTPHQVLTALLNNIVYLFDSFAQVISPRYSLVALLAAALIWCVLFLGLIRTFRDHSTPMTLWALCYLGTLLCWLWRPIRYAVPILPVLFFMLAEGLRSRRDLDAQQALRRRIIARVFIAACVVSAGLSTAGITATTIQTGTPTPTNYLHSVDWGQVMELCSWIRTNTPQQSVVSADLDPLFYLYTGRKAIRMFKSDPYSLIYEPESPQPLGSLDDFRTHIVRNKIAYLVMTPSDGSREGFCLHELVGLLLAKFPQAIRAVKRLDDSRYAIYAIDYKRL